MRRAIQMYCILYGCIGSILAFGWFLSALLGKFDETVSFFVVLGLFLLHGLAACLTFQRNPIRNRRWEPVVALTSSHIRLAKLVLTIGTLNFAACFVIFMVAAHMKDQVLLGKMIYLILTSLVLQNTIYIAVHWLIRPENIFPEWFIEVLINPLGFFLHR